MMQHYLLRRPTSSLLFWANIRKASQALAYDNFGDPSAVLKKVSIQNERVIKNGHVMVKYLASPINPADINTIQGVYPVKPSSFPAIAGNEGVAEVIRVGSGVKHVEIGESLIQNGGNSAVGLFVIQLARLWGIKTINVVRDRPDFGELRDHLKSLGADYVVTEEELRKREIMEQILSEIPKPNLALNCVGGQNATDCMRYLADNGTMVTYGGMSRKPVVIPTGLLIFKNQKYVGYWMTRWSQENFNSTQRTKMIEELCKLRLDDKLQLPKMEIIRLDDWKEAMQNISKGFTNVKYVFKFD
ncbi:trans-2-enoyl-CoA reductase, mitochondrial-like protein [Euroglyphus maynei]|uniref:Enoyl-[acyl-carrier-protein] reductase, mitochondrial n=1 Tax=Euroglyphus maynei TaxID=6958 RepID=A0A1Y3AZB3_EURMA|nr:trans-2-enoyl-CoA reductase, mitochondrial-like protein [Euroglyphus maynei]